MKIPLRDQITEYDCGPTSLLNGLSCLFEREELAPDLVRNIMLYSLDSFGTDGVCGKSGTSYAAMMFLSNWLDAYGKTGLLPVSSRYLAGREVNWGQQSRLRGAVVRGGAAVVRVDPESWHYVLVTGVRDEAVRLFDPYWEREPAAPGVTPVEDQPYSHNRLVAASRFEGASPNPYAFGPVETREAVLLFNTRTALTQEETVEYVI